MDQLAQRSPRRRATGTATAQREIELKFTLDEGALNALLKTAAFKARARTEIQRSVYFDTAGFDLQKAGCGLRVRRVGDRFVQTLKQAGAGSVDRGEWEVEVGGEQPELSALAPTPAGKLVKSAAALAPIFWTEVERSIRLWRGGGTSVEIAIDQGEVIAGERREPIFELELELKAGEPRGLFDLARRLAAAAPIRLAFASKAERGYRLAIGDPPTARLAQPLHISADATVAEGFRSVGWNCLEHFAANADLLRRRHSLETLHQARVGLRRFRAALTAFRPLMTGDGFEALKVETKWMAKALDQARDLDVFISETFQPSVDALADRKGLAAFGRRLLSAQTKAYKDAAAALDSDRCAKLLLTAADWLEAGAWAQAEDPILAALRERPMADFARERLDKLRRQTLKAGRKLETLDEAGRHALRIKAKKFRYTIEFFSSCFERAPKRNALLKTLKGLQDALGSLNDLAVARELAGGLVKEAPADVAFAAGQAMGRRQAEAAAAQDASADLFAKLKTSKLFWR